MDDANPFEALFFSPEDVQKATVEVKRQRKEVGSVLTRILLVNAQDHPHISERGNKLPKFLILLPQLKKDEQLKEKSGDLDIDNYVQALAERLQMSSPAHHLLILPKGQDKGLFTKERAVESSGVNYLACCYARLCAEREQCDNEVLEKLVCDCQKKIVQMAIQLISMEHRNSLLMQSNLQQTTFTSLLIQTLQGTKGIRIPLEFFTAVVEALSEDTETVKMIFEPVLSYLSTTYPDVTLTTPNMELYFTVMEFFSSNASLAKVLVTSHYWLPSARVARNGKTFETKSLLGRLLKPSPIAPSPINPSPCFGHDRLLQRDEIEGITASLHPQLESNVSKVCKIFNNLLRAGPEPKKALISWLVECFEKNSSRAQMSSRLMHGTLDLFSMMETASDGFFMNLCWVMLKLCLPFLVRGDGGTTARKVSRVASIDPSYCACKSREQCVSVDSGGPLVDFSKETKLVPVESDSESAVNTSPRAPFNFITHCFFLTHRCLILGMTRIIYKCQDMMRMTGRLHGAMQSLGQAAIQPGAPGHIIVQQFCLLQSQLLAVKAHALHPQLLELCLSFYSTTAQWMVQLVSNTGESHDPQVMSCDPTKLFPLPDKAPARVLMVPECVLENMANFALFLSSFRQTDMDALGTSRHHMDQFVTFVTVYMGSPQFIHNPHLRAKLAQLLHLMIHRANQSEGLASESQKELFSSNKVASGHLIRSLLSIFIDIEFTGESMEFEDKFQYRLPMYEVLEFLWCLPSFRASIELLSEQAIQSADLLKTPIFLRFINMIVNDATVQLDEGLASLEQIKEVEDAMKSEEWATYNAEQKKEYQMKLEEAKMMAKNRNLLAGKTMKAMMLITADTKRPFVIPVIVDRMVAMLNYVLKKLVGPKNKDLKVKDADKKYHFNPRELVTGLIQVYLNLGEEEAFCEALPRDGRSFSLDLFIQTERVLWLMSTPVETITQLRLLSEKVRVCQEKMVKEEEAFENVPEEFIDPITQELMRDPVTLPNSGHIMDRASIITHLLNDQTDPFNRSPLTADMLIPNDQLKQQIEEWKRQQLETSSH